MCFPLLFDYAAQREASEKGKAEKGRAGENGERAKKEEKMRWKRLLIQDNRNSLRGNSRENTYTG